VRGLLLLGLLRGELRLGVALALAAARRGRGPPPALTFWAASRLGVAVALLSRERAGLLLALLLLGGELRSFAFALCCAAERLETRPPPRRRSAGLCRRRGALGFGFSLLRAARSRFLALWRR
jgi:hypothetical protein